VEQPWPGAPARWARTLKIVTLASPPVDCSLAACSLAPRLLSAAAAIAGPRPCPHRRPLNPLVSSRMRVELRVGPRTNDAEATCVTSGRRPRLEPPRLSAGARGGCAARVDDAVRADLPESSTAPAPTRAHLLNASSLTAERGTAGSAARRVPARSLPRSSSDSDEPRSMSPVEPYRVVVDMLHDRRSPRVWQIDVAKFHKTLRETTPTGRSHCKITPPFHHNSTPRLPEVHNFSRAPYLSARGCRVRRTRQAERRRGIARRAFVRSRTLVCAPHCLSVFPRFQADDCLQLFRPNSVLTERCRGVSRSAERLQLSPRGGRLNTGIPASVPERHRVRTRLRVSDSRRTF
jgi:hypothetical protein